MCVLLISSLPCFCAADLPPTLASFPDGGRATDSLQLDQVVCFCYYHNPIYTYVPFVYEHDASAHDGHNACTYSSCKLLHVTGSHSNGPIHNSLVLDGTLHDYDRDDDHCDIHP